MARGAVCRGLEGVENSAITIRLARKFYGTPASEPYISGLHDERDMYVDELTGRKMARGQMTWLCDKGSRLPERSPKTMSISVCRHFTADDDDRTCTAVLVGCEEDEAPQRFAEDGA